MTILRYEDFVPCKGKSSIVPPELICDKTLQGISFAHMHLHQGSSSLPFLYHFNNELRVPSENSAGNRVHFKIKRG